MTNGQVNIGDAVFNDIDSNEFLRELYANLLHNYGLYRLKLTGRAPLDVDLEAALRFADLLSKSTHPHKRDVHRVWAQEIALLCQILYPENRYTKAYVPAIFTTLGNYPGLRQLGATSDAGILAAAFEAYQSEYLTIPGVPDMKFFAPQKKIYDRLAAGEFSFSAPTSLGKSFIMRTFITSQVKAESRANYAIIVPTKALINETRSKLIGELEEELERHNYRIVSAAGDIVLEGEHHFIFVLTPERLLYLLISKPDLRFDYVFFDESHKLSGKNSRAPFYYQTVTLLQNRLNPPHIIFASPNIPNPEVFLRLVSPYAEFHKNNAIATRYSPVVQFKYLVDMNERKVLTYNDYSQEFTHLASLTDESVTPASLIRFLTQSTPTAEGKRAQTIVFYAGRQRAVEAAEEYARHLPPLNDRDLDALAKDVERDVHEDYYLCDLLRKGIAYHIGYLPPAIRERIEDLFRAGKLTTLFCTSTLLEGVNLPADNLVITTNKIGRPNMTPVDFKNLIGRVGRIEYNLYGDVFIITGEGLASRNTTEALLQTEIPKQKLSIETDSKVISKSMKEGIVDALKEGNVQFSKGDESYEVYEMKRKFGLILLRDITQGRDSLVRHEFAPFLDGDTVRVIREAFVDRADKQDDDINVSIDQAGSLTDAIRAGLKYPALSSDGKFNYDDTLGFLERLARIFKWDAYDSQTLGKTSDDGSRFTLLRWYAVLLNQWMEGHGLRSIMNRALDYRRLEGTIYIPWKGPMAYNDSPAQRNIVFGDILKTIEEVILFSLSNYFLKFSNEYKTFHGVEQFDNDWYEYVEYGTTNPLTILLQRFGFTRESSTYIRNNLPNCLRQEGNQYYLNPALLESPNTNVRKEANEIRFNVPEAFTWPGSVF
ncbi:MAG: helicase-related protein [Actinomyces sp.]|nr:helicase-related protein [Actinomyces sp.]